MAEITPERACQIVDEIRFENGGITDEERAATPPGVLKALENVRRRLYAIGSQNSFIGRRYNVLAKPQFAVEMINNTTTLSYTWARTRGMEPFLAFTLLPDRIVVDCNGDGYNQSDVVGLCSFTKPLFKQANLFTRGDLRVAFEIASKVHIQSGPFSFSLRHRQGEDGLGMITPVNEVKDSLPETVQTRLTLHLIQPEQFDELAKGMSEIFNKGFLLFNLKCMNFSLNIRPRHGNPTQISFKVQVQGDSMELVRMANTVVVSDRYLIVKSSFPQILFSFPAVTVRLGFPVDRDSRPLVRPQSFYQTAGMCGFPICPAGLNVSCLFNVCIKNVLTFAYYSLVFHLLVIHPRLDQKHR